MLYEILLQALDAAYNSTQPYVEHWFRVPKEESNEFWSNPAHEKERAILYDEWELMPGRIYCKRIYGVKFYIQFESE